MKSSLRVRPAFALALVATLISAVGICCSRDDQGGGELAPDVGPLADTREVDLPVTIELEPFLEAPNSLVYLTHAGDGSGRIFLVEKQGRILIVEGDALSETPFLDIVDLVRSQGGEQGLLGLAFAPDYPSSGELYVYYTANPDGRTVIARYRRGATPDAADPASAQVLLEIDDFAENHNGGQLAFGPDGFLYVGTGDGGGAGDPRETAQDLGSLLGKLLRLDIGGGGAYSVPASSPFAGDAEARGEIWAYGLRNPWRFSFDRETGDLFIGDVGQNAFEEIDYQPAQSGGGENYGWDVVEGFHCFEPLQDCDPAGAVFPVAAYPHQDGACSVTGGYVYRGTAEPPLEGIYLFGDFCSGHIWGLQRAADAFEMGLLLDSDVNIASFGEDEAGELYVVALNGAVFRVRALPR